MSSTTRTTVRGGKGTKGDTISKTQKPDKTDTSKAEKNKSGKPFYFYHVYWQSNPYFSYPFILFALKKLLCFIDIINQHINSLPIMHKFQLWPITFYYLTYFSIETAFLQ